MSEGKPEAIFLREADPSASCEVCSWPTEGLAQRLVEAMRERHGKGGINVCIDCVTRARDEGMKKAGIRAVPDGVYNGRHVQHGTCRPWCGGLDPKCPVHGQRTG